MADPRDSSAAAGEASSGDTDGVAGAAGAAPAPPPRADVTDPWPGLDDGLPAASGDPDAEPDLPDELTLVTRERDDYLDSLRRLQADFDNYRKRARADIELEVGRASEKIISRLIPVLDTFELAFAHEVDADGSPLAKVHDQLLQALEAEGLERLAPTGQPFDPAEAEAVMYEPAEGDAGQTVSEVLRAGYRWRGRIVRAAMVKVKG